MENKVKVKNWNAYMQTTMYTNILLSIRSANDFLFHSSIIFPRANLHGRRILQIHWVASTLRNGFDLQPLKMSSANNNKNINDLCCWKCLHMWVGNHLKIHYYTCMHENVYFYIIYFYHSISCTTQLKFIVDIFCGCIHYWNGLQIWITFQ